MLELTITKRTDERLLELMAKHYSAPKGFVGRNICYAITYDGIYYGHIVAGSATKFLPNRNAYLGIMQKQLNNVINNIFFSVAPAFDRYPQRNFTTQVVRLFMQRAPEDWFLRYGDICYGFETLVEKPRTGLLYLKAGWQTIGETKGFTCKRVGGVGSDSWGGRRVWNTDKNALRPKFVLAYKL